MEKKQFTESVGIDVSKQTLDVHLYLKKQHRQFANTDKGFLLIQKWIKAEIGENAEVIYCFEHTG